MSNNQTKPTVRGRPRKLLVNPKYRRQMFVFASHPDLFTVVDVARFQGINRDTAGDDLRDVVNLKREDILK